MIVDSWTVPVVSDQPWNVLVAGGKRNKIFFCLGTAYNVSSMESVGMLQVIFVGGKSMPLKMFLSLNFRFELWHLYKFLLPSTKGLSFTLCNFYF